MLVYPIINQIIQIWGNGSNYHEKRKNREENFGIWEEKLRKKTKNPKFDKCTGSNDSIGWIFSPKTINVQASKGVFIKLKNC